MSRVRKNSNEWKRLQAKRAKHNRDVANRRDYLEWLLAKEVCRDTKLVVLEDLRISAMSRKDGNYKKWLNREFRFVRHSEILRKIEVVDERLGIEVIRVNPKNTSKLCHACSRKGTREGESFTYGTCGTFHADGNAAVNILQKGGGLYPPEAGIAFVRRELYSPSGTVQQVEPGGTHAFECSFIPDDCSEATTDKTSQRENQACPVPQNVRRHRVTDGYNSLM